MDATVSGTGNLVDEARCEAAHKALARGHRQGAEAVAPPPWAVMWPCVRGDVADSLSSSDPDEMRVERGLAVAPLDDPTRGHQGAAGFSTERYVRAGAPSVGAGAWARPIAGSEAGGICCRAVDKAGAHHRFSAARAVLPTPHVVSSKKPSSGDARKAVTAPTSGANRAALQAFGVRRELPVEIRRHPYRNNRVAQDRAIHRRDRRVSAMRGFQNFRYFRCARLVPGGREAVRMMRQGRGLTPEGRCACPAEQGSCRSASVYPNGWSMSGRAFVRDVSAGVCHRR